MKQVLLLSGLLFTTLLYAQVGIQTTNPQSLLDLSTLDPSNPDASDGLLIPRMSTFPSTNPTGTQHGMLVYLNTDLTDHTVDTTPRDYPAGFYYWNSSLTDWSAISADDDAWKRTGNANITPGTHFLGTTNASEIEFRVNNRSLGNLTEKGQFTLDSEGQSVFIGVNAGANDAPADASDFHQSVAIGYGAYENNTDGQNNVAVGYLALAANTTGNLNTAIGHEALRSNTTGVSNTAVGNDALEVNTTGRRNVAVGFDALEENTTGDENTAIGYDALTLNTTGGFNTALGFGALGNNTTANDNTAVGYNALTANTTGDANVAVGHDALLSNTTGRENVVMGEDGAELLTTGSGNTVVGSDAFDLGTTGNNNVILGRDAGSTLTTGSSNVVIGAYANNTGTAVIESTAVGYSSIASQNKSLAYGAYAQATGVEAIALGANTIASGEDSVAIGDDAEAHSEESIAIGNNVVVTGGSEESQALGHTTRIENNSDLVTLLGSYSTSNNVQNAVSLGHNATLQGASTNVLSVGNNNVIDGGVSNVAALGSSITINNSYTNSTGVGYQASPTQSNQIRLGNTNITNIMGQVAITTTSDKRFKKEVKKDVAGLEFITRLEPVSYVFDKVKLSQHLNEDQLPEATQERTVGFMAQDVERIANEIGFDFSGIKTPDAENDIYGLSYASFVVPLVKAVQEQQTELEILRKKVEELETLKAEFAALKALLLEE
ncbi:tail fiber domain-containing protein [Flavobacteriaceae bacterium YJPT1-3]|nr:tail fiber domain-containing protein [Flavobacteriaceae bacterium YJPT1-3]